MQGKLIDELYKHIDNTCIREMDNQYLARVEGGTHSASVFQHSCCWDLCS